MKTVVLVLLSLSVVFLFYILFIFPGNIIEKFLKIPDLKDPMYFLVVGHDRNIKGTSRADVIIVVGVKFKDRKISFLSIPRDLVWNGKRVNSYFNKGVDELIKVVENITGVKIDKYAVFDYRSFKILGDELGPIEVTVKEPMNYTDKVQSLNINFLPGVHKLNGEQLLAYIRYRKGGMGDLDRIRRQREVFSKIFSKALNMSPSKAFEVYSKLMKSVETNVSQKELIGMLLKLKGEISLSFFQVPTVPQDNGTLKIDWEKFEEVKRSFLEFKKPKEKKSYNIIVMNAKRNKSKYFRPIEEKRWLLTVGFKPKDILWEDTGIVLKGSLLLVCTKDHEAKDEIYDLVEKVYPHRHFKLKWAAYLDGADLYYEIENSALKIRRFLKKPVDAIVVLGEVGG